jgi:hypothetical protein
MFACGFEGRADGLASILPKKIGLFHDNLLIRGASQLRRLCEMEGRSLYKSAHFNPSYAQSKFVRCVDYLRSLLYIADGPQGPRTRCLTKAAYF